MGTLTNDGLYVGRGKSPKEGLQGFSFRARRPGVTPLEEAKARMRDCKGGVNALYISNQVVGRGKSPNEGLQEHYNRTTGLLGKALEEAKARMRDCKSKSLLLVPGPFVVGRGKSPNEGLQVARKKGTRYV